MKKSSKTEKVETILGLVVIVIVLGVFFSWALRETPLGVSYSQVTEPFLKDMTFKQVEDYKGLPEYTGVTSDGTIYLSIRGNKENISEIMLIMDLRKNPPIFLINQFFLPDRYTTKMKELLKVATPEWEDKYSWRGEAVTKLLGSPKSKRETITVDEKRIEIGWIQDLVMYLNIKHS